MPTYRCRSVLPKESNWHTVEGTSPEDAAQNLHLDSKYHELAESGLRIRTDDGRSFIVSFMRVEVEGEAGTFVSKAFQHGLWRSGGVRPRGPVRTIADVAKEIAWEGRPEELLETWAGEETLDGAAARQAARWNLQNLRST